jgi:hypothetical protein
VEYRDIASQCIYIFQILSSPIWNGATGTLILEYRISELFIGSRVLGPVWSYPCEVITALDPTMINDHDFPSASNPYSSKNLYVLLSTISLLLVTSLAAPLDRSILHLSRSL